VGQPDEKRTQEGVYVGGGKIHIKMDGVGWGGMDWIDLAQNRDQWRARVNTAMNLRIP
jgi:hypothetical protein